ncbi:uncharacterized protein LOC129598534 [Paramacrobiotus metropolitanus]|uniref:uncharacterized protein LOC129598534 n=1 Tax=Paramacrobiotus metropolitanus TaxID=2943436 RepID=UPI002445C06F|nr:uncharacterized protein LOC129598534 [Paramacrobiotus metropolitanus]
METSTVGIFFGVWAAVTVLIVLGCKLFARYCYSRWGVRANGHPEAGATTNNITIVINGVPNDTGSTGNSGLHSPEVTRRMRLLNAMHHRLHRQRSQSLSAVDTVRLPPGATAGQSSHNRNRRRWGEARQINELPPTYQLAVSHPSIYRPRKSVPCIFERQETIPPPPHYDDLQIDTSFSVDLRVSVDQLDSGGAALSHNLSVSAPNLFESPAT